MNLEYLKFFYQVACAKSISKVANNSHISQPALSQQIKRLEDGLGYKLLTRSNKGVELTEEGKIVQKYAKSLIRTYEVMIEDLNAISKNNSTIRIDASPPVATYALPCTIYEIKEEYPDYVYKLTSNHSKEVEQNVINDICDVGFIHGEPEDCTLKYLRVGIDRVVVVAAQNYNIPPENYCEDIIRRPMILLHDNSKFRRSLNQYFENKGYNTDDFNVIFSLDMTESVKSSVIKGYGLSFLPYIALKKELYTNQLKEVKVKDFNMNYEIYMIYKPHKEMSKAVVEFIQYFKKIGEKSFC